MGDCPLLLTTMTDSSSPSSRPLAAAAAIMSAHDA
jgi:hypothetical protein